MTLAKVLNTFKKEKTFLVTSHAFPDGDALGSMIGLGLGLKKLGKRVKFYSEMGVAPNLQFLLGKENVSKKLALSEKFDVGIILDCAEKERVSKTFTDTKNIKTLVVVDHHRKSGKCGDINYIDPTAAATGVLVDRILKKLNVKLNKQMAQAIFCTLVTDTGSFRYSNTDASVLELAAKLTRLGASPSNISGQIYEQFPANRYKLLGKVLNSLELTDHEKIASITITQGMYKATKTSGDLVEGFIDYPRSISTVKVALQFRQIKNGEFKVSFRSKKVIDVAKLAAKFGGGGHHRAAGCTIPGPLKTVKKKVLAAVRKTLTNARK